VADDCRHVAGGNALPLRAAVAAMSRDLVPRHGRARRGGSDRGALLGRRRSVPALQALDQIRDVGEFLLEVALLALEPLEDVLAAVPAAPERRAAEAATMMMSVHVFTSFRSA
jgi:hypothetical protein